MAAGDLSTFAKTRVAFTKTGKSLKLKVLVFNVNLDQLHIVHQCILSGIP
jgi:hypothetical protein